MIIKDKIKSKLKAKSKILVLGFITLLALVGFLGAGTQVNAQAVPTNQDYLNCINPARPLGTQVECATRNPDKIPTPTGTPTNQNYLDCINPAKPLGTPAQCATTNPDTAASLAVAPKTDFEKYVAGYGCGLTADNSLFPGCLISGFYYLFYVIPAFMLWLAAYFFNVLISITLSSKLFAGSTFIPMAWAIVRDLSNIFFILILLYIAIKLILGLGGSEVKKMIAKVVIIALLINFSMFFTEVIIDSSNILALIFYNKTSVSTKNADGTDRPYDSVTGEKDVAGGMVNAFDPTRLLTADFFKTAGTVNTGIIGAAPIQGQVSFGMLIGITILAGVIMLFAAYCLFIAGISFLGRMIEFFVLIIFSPFAFMSSTIPLLEKVEYIGWDAWFKRLLTVSFMAPIFMFFIYFIFLLISVKPPLFDSLVTQTGQGTMVRILSIVIPAMIVLILLMKATSFAKKASGTLGEFLIKGTEIAMGAVAGVGLGVAAKGLQGTAGHWGKMAADSGRMKDWATAKTEDQTGRFRALKSWGKRRVGSSVTTVGGKAAGASFDARQGAVGGVLATIGGVSGLNLGHSSKLFRETGGYKADLVKRKAKDDARVEELKVSANEPEEKALRAEKEAHQKLLLSKTTDDGIDGTQREMTVEQRLEKVDKRTEDQEKTTRQAREKVTIDPTDENRAKAKTEMTKLENLQLEKKAIMAGGIEPTRDPNTGETKYSTTNGNISQRAVDIATSAEDKEKSATDAATKNVEAKSKVKAQAIKDEEQAQTEKTSSDNEVTAKKKEAQDADTEATRTATDAAGSTDSKVVAAATDAMAKKTNADKAVAEATKKQQKAIENVTASTKVKDDAVKAETDAIKAQEGAAYREINASRIANDAVNAKTATLTTGGKLGNSIFELATNVIPEKQNAVNRLSKGRARAQADIIENKWWRFWSQEARTQNAHDIRMGAKAEVKK